MRPHISEIQEAIRNIGADAWAMYDFRGSNSLAWDVLQIYPGAHCTRRWMVVIPAHGRTTAIVHRMERDPLSHINAAEVVYATKAEWEQALRETLAPYRIIAMEYSPNNAIPVVSKVDAGTIEFIRGLGHEVVSSADAAQMFSSVLTEQQLAGAAVSAGLVRDAIFEGFELVRTSLLNGESVTEFEVQRHVVQALRARDLTFDDPPIVAIGPNAANPHYQPSATGSAVVGPDMAVMIDAWGRHDSPGSVYADLTWVGYTAAEVPADVDRTFKLLVKARDAALDLITQRFRDGLNVCGYEVDDVCRAVIAGAGLGSNFIHRTGHSITTELHGSGVNMDNYETHDNRRLLRNTTFSIEPGVYFDGSLGLRTEIGVVIDSAGNITVPSAPMQTSILPLFHHEWRQ